MRLRALEESDLKKLKDWRNNRKVRSTVREFRLLNMISQKMWFESMTNENPPKSIMFGIMDNKNKLIGVCGLTYLDWKNKHAELSCYLVLKNWQKTKQAKNAIELMIQYGFHELNLHRIWAEVFAIAVENKTMLEKLNFVQEGVLREKLWRDGKWWDSFIYSMLHSEYGDNRRNV